MDAHRRCEGGSDARRVALRVVLTMQRVWGAKVERRKEREKRRQRVARLNKTAPFRERMLGETAKGQRV